MHRMLLWTGVPLCLLMTVAGCGDRRTSTVGDDSGGQAGQPDSGYELTYCDDGEVRTARCNEGICDPYPFDVCDDGSCVLLPATCDAPPPPRPMIEVTIRNASPATVYIDGLSSMPFSLEDSSGGAFRASSDGSLLFMGSCDACDEICASDLHSDPMPCYLELAAGAELHLRWSGELIVQQSCPSCWATCYQVSSIEPGDYRFVVPYRSDLEQTGHDFIEVACSPNQGLPSWMSSSGFGVPQFDQRAEIAVTHSGQAALLLRIE